MPRTIEMEPIYKERVSARRFFKVFSSRDAAGELKSVRIIAPRVGKRGDFGSIEIEHIKPIFKMKPPKSNKVKRSAKTSTYKLRVAK